MASNGVNKPLVGIIMGSDSDLAVMSEAAKVLQELGIGSGGATLSPPPPPPPPLAGVVAAHTALPVIGVPIMNKATAGVDALFSTVQMPPGIPVATVAINGAKNAGILAAQIIGAGDSNVLQNVRTFKEKMAKDITAKDAKLQEKGFKKYLEDAGLI